MKLMKNFKKWDMNLSNMKIWARKGVLKIHKQFINNYAIYK